MVLTKPFLTDPHRISDRALSVRGEFCMEISLVVRLQELFCQCLYGSSDGAVDKNGPSFPSELINGRNDKLVPIIRKGDSPASGGRCRFQEAGNKDARTLDGVFKPSNGCPPDELSSPLTCRSPR